MSEVVDFFQVEEERLREWAKDASKPILAAYARVAIKVAEKEMAAAGGQ